MTRKLNLLASLFAVVFLSACAGMETKTGNTEPSTKTVPAVTPDDGGRSPVSGRIRFVDCRSDAKGNNLGECIPSNEGALPRKTEYKLVSKVVSPVPSKGVGADTFDKKGQCLAALESGEYRYYVPKAKYSKKLPAVDGEGRQVMPIEKDACVHMFTVHGWQWVAQKDGDKFRFDVKDGKLKIYARDDCGNPAKEIAYLPTGKEDKVVEKEYRIFAVAGPTKAPETGWYRKSVVVMKEVITERPVAVASGCYDGCGGGGYVGFNGWIGNSGAVIGAPYVVQPAQAYVAGPTISGRTLPQVAPTISGNTLPQTSFSGRTLPQSSFSGRTLPQTSFSGRNM